MAQSSGYSTHDKGTTHAVPLKILFGVFLALMVFTVATVAVSELHLPPSISIWVALGIALLKAALVALFFMHLWWDSPFNGLVLIVALLFVALFIGIATLDTEQYQPDMDRPASLPQQ